jgi:hypothetical protein
MTGLHVLDFRQFEGLDSPAVGDCETMPPPPETLQYRARREGIKAH